MLKAIKQFVIFLGITSAILWTISLPVFAADQQTGGQQPAGPQTLLPLDGSNYQNLPHPPQGSAQAQFYDLVFGVVQNVRYIIGAVAIALIVFSGVRMIIAQGNEEVYTKQRTSILFAVIGLAVVGLSGEVIRILQVSCDVVPTGQQCTAGGFLKDPNAIIRTATIFSQRTQFIVVFIKYLIGSVAVLMIVRSGIRMIALGSMEDKVALDKKNLMYGIIGLVMIIMSDTIISKVFYNVDLSRYPTVGGAQPSINPGRGVAEVVGFTNIVVNIVGPLAVLGLVAGAVMYVASAGNEDQQGKAKRIITATLIGILLMYGAFAIVSTFVSGNFAGDNVGQTTQQTGTNITP